MRPWPILILFVASLAGCATDDAQLQPAFPLTVYRFAYEGSDVAIEGVEHGWLIQIANPTGVAYRTTILPSGLQEALLGPVGNTDGIAPREVFLPARIEGGQTTAPLALDLGPGESGVFLVKVSEYNGTGPEREVGFRAFAAPLASPDTISQAYRELWNVSVLPASTAVVAGDHVSTVTVGVWTNGTSFYTNAADLIADPAFPAGFDRAETATDALPIYVYGADREEQPEASKDACRFTTIDGYNDLLKSQAAGSTGVSLLRPEAAYTREGNEDHFLYGQALIFLNTVVSHDGPTEPVDSAPDPTGPCFANRLAGLPLP